MIEKILEKPEHHRQKVAYIATLVVGVFIFSAWLVIANFNIRQAFNPYGKEEDTKVAQDFKKTLPSLRQSESVTTELTKDQKNPAGNEETTETTESAQETDKPFWKFW